MIYSKLLIFFKGPKIAAGTLGGLMGFGLADMTTSSVGVAGITAIVTAPLAALLATWPKVIQANKEARASDSELALKQMEALFAKEQQMHAERAGEANATINRYARERALMRHTKHMLGNELQAAIYHIQMLEFQMKAGGMEFTHYKPASLQDIYAEEDRGLLEMSRLEPRESEP